MPPHNRPEETTWLQAYPADAVNHLLERVEQAAIGVCLMLDDLRDQGLPVDADSARFEGWLVREFRLWLSDSLEYPHRERDPDELARRRRRRAVDRYPVDRVDLEE